MLHTEITGSPAYTAARERLAYYVPANPGCLSIRGETRVDYLQRQSTNDLSLLSPSRALPNILTSASGRILDVFTLLEDGASLMLITQPGHAAGLAAYFKRHIFFNDQVSIEDVSARWAQVDLHGPGAAAAILKLGFSQAPQCDEVVQIETHGQPHWVIGEEGFGSPGYKLLVSASDAEHVARHLNSLGAEPLDPSTREVLRVESGKPGAPEFIDAYTPFEIGLEGAVSAEKGCYTGQEVLARQVTYEKIVRRLVQLRAQEPIAAGAAVVAGDVHLGTVSSVAVSPRLGPLALAVLRKPYDQPGAAVEIRTENRVVAAVISTTP